MYNLNHVALTVSDRAASAAFYKKWFGMANPVHDDEHLLILADDQGALLALSEGEVPRDLPRTNHFGFQAKTVEEVLAFRKAAGEAGLSEAEWQEKMPTRVQVLDPDGYRVELYAF